MASPSLVKISGFHAAVFFHPTTGEFHGWVLATLGDPQHSDRSIRIDDNRDINIIYEELCEEFGQWMVMLLEEARTRLPLF